jgi:hypothetical protein
VSAATLERVTFSVSRAADFLETRALVSQTGQDESQFGDVIVKELLDNSLDACETAGVQPDIRVTATLSDDGCQRITVADNGCGIPPDVVGRILDFATLTSDKALYRSPCRGAQGNALKTIVGIPFALGVTDPVVIEAADVRHVITVGLDLAGNVKVGHVREGSPQRAGTSVTVTLPCDLEVDVAGWVAGYALVNPHATFSVVGLGDGREPVAPETYKATAGEGWRKPVPTDPTCAWWYDRAAFTRLAASLVAAGRDRPLGAFVAEFKGLSGTAKRKGIAAAVPGARRVSDLVENPEPLGAMLAAMQQASAEPKVAALGQVAGEHYRDLLDRLYGVERFWYAHGGIVCDGIPWHAEVAVAETTEPGETVWGCNYGVSFGDPLGEVSLRTAEVSSWGAASFLSYCDAAPGFRNNHRRAAVVHVTCAAPVFTDKGKVRLSVPPEVADAAGRILWAAAKVLYRERQQSERDHKAAEREARAAKRKQMSLKDAVFAVIPESVERQQGGTDLSYLAHDLFYKIRPLVQRLTDKKLGSRYCEHVLIPAYEREHGELRGMYRKARGTMFHPHDRSGAGNLPLGTREVDAYIPPGWTFGKILAVEKEGRAEEFIEAGLAERYDMAIVGNEGFSAVASRKLLVKIRKLLKGTHGQDVTVFSLHDADLWGYDLHQVLGEPTVRLPGHQLEVVDLGLTVAEAIRLHGTVMGGSVQDLEPEWFEREEALPGRIIPRLTDTEREWFTGTPCDWDGMGNPKRWRGLRVELNAFTGPGLVAYAEAALAAHGADGKLVPPAAVIAERLRQQRDQGIADYVRRAVDDLVDIDAITRAVQRAGRRHDRHRLSPGTVRGRLEDRRELSWRDVADQEAQARLRRSPATSSQLVAALLKEQLDAMFNDPKGARP